MQRPDGDRRDSFHTSSRTFFSFILSDPPIPVQRLVHQLRSFKCSMFAKSCPPQDTHSLSLLRQECLPLGFCLSCQNRCLQDVTFSDDRAHGHEEVRESAHAILSLTMRGPPDKRINSNQSCLYDWRVLRCGAEVCRSRDGAALSDRRGRHFDPGFRQL